MERGEAFEQVKASWRRWPHIPAVKNDRIFLVDSNIFDRPSPRLVDGLELLAKLIHPELFDHAEKE
jgi:iron complex transport system substrate-binding protein